MGNRPTALQRAISAAGSQAALARLLTPIMGRKISQGHVSHWLRFGVSEAAALPIAKAVGFAVRPHELRRDIYPYRDDAVPPRHRSRTGYVPPRSRINFSPPG